MGQTEYANFVTNVVILHKELVTLYHMLREIPGKGLVQNAREHSKGWFNDARCKVCSYARLRRCKNAGNKKTGYSLDSSIFVPPPYLS